MPATYSSFLYCGPISNKAGPPPPRRGRDGERGAEGGRRWGRNWDEQECTTEGWEGQAGPRPGMGWVLGITGGPYSVAALGES